MVIHKFNDKILTSTSRRSEAVIAKISAKNDSHRRKEQIYKQKSSIFFFADKDLCLVYYTDQFLVQKKKEKKSDPVSIYHVRL